MAGSVNKVILVGNLGKDPEIRRTQDGRPIANLSVATSENWRDKATGERKEKTEWHRVVIFNEGLCKVAEQYLKKGAKVYIEGQLQTRKWTDQSGVEKYSTEVVLQGFNSNLTMLDGRSGGSGGLAPTIPLATSAPVDRRVRRAARSPPQAPATATWTTIFRSVRMIGPPVALTDEPGRPHVSLAPLLDAAPKSLMPWRPWRRSCWAWSSCSQRHLPHRTLADRVKIRSGRLCGSGFFDPRKCLRKDGCRRRFGGRGENPAARVSLWKNEGKNHARGTVRGGLKAPHTLYDS